MATHEAIPFLPGNTFRDVTKTDFRKAHTLDYLNGYAIQPNPILGIGLTPIPHSQLSGPAELLAKIKSDPRLTYGSKQHHHAAATIPRFVPAHVAFDKVVLRFDAYFKQTVHESQEQYHLRRVRIHYFVEDDSIAVVEPPVENSGIPQGVLIKRQRLPKSTTDYYSVKDFNLGINVVFYGKTFRIVSCDAFTERYLRESEHIVLNPPEPMPKDPQQIARNRPHRNPSLKVEHHDKLRRFLENDRKVLRFFCVWDDRESMFGELREFVLHYYLVDDCVEVREVQKPNNGRDPFPILLRKQRLQKTLNELTAVYDDAYYTWKDFKIGGVINVLGRTFLIRDCDEYTKRYYHENLGVPISTMQSIPIISPSDGAVVEQEIPPYNGYGSVEDSLGSCKYLVLKPPKKDFIKMLENEHKILRFVARMESRHKEDQNRRFVISYRLADDTMTIYEPPQRNAGILGGKFMERTRVLRPGSSLSSPQGPAYYVAEDLVVGATIEIFKHRFVLLDADEYVFNYFEERFDKSRGSSAEGGRGGAVSGPVMERSDRARILGKVVQASRSGRVAVEKSALLERLRGMDTKRSGVVDRKALLDACADTWRGVIDQHEAITLCRQFEPTPRKVDYQRLLDATFA
ncbi:hypothetical protein DFJ73DRAFT_965443 [Zopfochytrium polystomum]|nr:hypothetical protein DFJ73DRAFT_965443 [Zopfochytrium polystomum]